MSVFLFMHMFHDRSYGLAFVVDLMGKYDPSMRLIFTLRYIISWFYSQIYESVFILNQIKSWLYDRFYRLVSIFRQINHRVGQHIFSQITSLFRGQPHVLVSIHSQIINSWLHDGPYVSVSIFSQINLYFFNYVVVESIPTEGANC